MAGVVDLDALKEGRAGGSTDTRLPLMSKTGVRAAPSALVGGEEVTVVVSPPGRAGRAGRAEG